MSQQVQNEISKVIVELQFQDRISQKLRHVEANLLKTHQIIEESSGLEADERLAKFSRLQSDIRNSYTMEEEHHSHDAAVGEDKSKSNQTADIEFF